jgi:hypothetical protein
VVKRRLPFFAVLAAVVVGAAVAVALLVRDERAPSLGLPVGDDGIAARSSVSGRSLLFGEQLIARLELLVDREILDPDRVTVDAEFDPFSPSGKPFESRTDYDRFTSMRFEYPIECLTTACVPETVTKLYDLPSVTVRHERVPVEIVEWPRLTINSRVGEPTVEANNPTAQPGFDLPWRANLRVQPATYRVDPTLLTALFAGVALLLLVATLYFAQRAFPGAPLGFRRLRRVKLTPLERALVVLERAHEQGIEREQRLALDQLAHELRTGGQQELAGTARELAWEQSVPDSDRTSTLTDRVRAVIAGRTNGRP